MIRHFQDSSLLISNLTNLIYRQDLQAGVSFYIGFLILYASSLFYRVEHFHLVNRKVKVTLYAEKICCESRICYCMTQNGRLACADNQELKRQISERHGSVDFKV